MRNAHALTMVLAMLSACLLSPRVVDADRSRSRSESPAPPAPNTASNTAAPDTVSPSTQSCFRLKCAKKLYLLYGLYCGRRHAGHGNPNDHVDTIHGLYSCCQAYNRCYFRTGCDVNLIEVEKFAVTCHGNGTNSCDATGNGGETTCTHKICDCAVKVATCFNRHPCPAAMTPISFMAKYQQSARTGRIPLMINF